MWWSFVLAAIGVTGLYLTTREGGTRWAGYGVGLLVQFLWIAYALVTMQYGFILSALAYGAVNTIAIIKGIRQWRRESVRRRSSDWRIWSTSHAGDRRWYVDQPNGSMPGLPKQFASWAAAVQFTLNGGK
ncbi:hypothetical protein [Rhodococcoides fascians]|uniref:hypothetical protein n=1 Tax=Rhodococcoides fascians TaxID=1828 RepID=UPI000AF08C3C|nr:hypothetical protein [Rhodococcus fascians]